MSENFSSGTINPKQRNKTMKRISQQNASNFHQPIFCLHFSEKASCAECVIALFWKYGPFKGPNLANIASE